MAVSSINSRFVSTVAFWSIATKPPPTAPRFTCPAADASVTLNWLLHANGPFELGSNTFRYRGARAGFYGKILWSEGGDGSLSQVTGFPDIDPADFEGLDISTHLDIAFPASTRHRVAVLLVPYRLDAPKRVFNFLDDQGYDVNLYLTDTEERSFKVVVPKSFAAVGGS